MESQAVLREIMEQGVIPVIRADSASSAEQISAALYDGGMRVLEVTFTVSGAAAAIERLRNRWPDAVVGAGTVLDGETARIATLAGAAFVVSLIPSLEVAEVAGRYGVPYILGGQTAAEVVRAMGAGSSLVKVFPASVVGPGFVRELRGPLPGAQFFPTGGITEENMGAWFDQGVAAVGVGGALIKGASGSDGLRQLTFRAKRYLELARELRDPARDQRQK